MRPLASARLSRSWPDTTSPTGRCCHDCRMTSVALVLAPLACAVVLLVSGWAKLGAEEATRAGFAAMGVPQALRAAIVVKALPYAEIALGALLLVAWAWPLAVVA